MPNFIGMASSGNRLYSIKPRRTARPLTATQAAFKRQPTCAPMASLEPQMCSNFLHMDYSGQGKNKKLHNVNQIRHISSLLFTHPPSQSPPRKASHLSHPSLFDSHGTSCCLWSSWLKHFSSVGSTSPWEKKHWKTRIGGFISNFNHWNANPDNFTTFVLVTKIIPPTYWMPQTCLTQNLVQLQWQHLSQIKTSNDSSKVPAHFAVKIPISRFEGEQVLIRHIVLSTENCPQKSSQIHPSNLWILTVAVDSSPLSPLVMPWYSHPKNSSHELWTRLALTAFRWFHHSQKPLVLVLKKISPQVVGPRNPGFWGGYKMVQISYNFPSDHPNPCNSPGLQIIQSDLRLR